MDDERVDEKDWKNFTKYAYAFYGKITSKKFLKEACLYFKDKVSELNSEGQLYGDPQGGTPTSEAFYEMYRYMMGLSPVYGDYSGTTKDADPKICLEYEQEETCEEVPVFRKALDSFLSEMERKSAAVSPRNS